MGMHSHEDAEIFPKNFGTVQKFKHENDNEDINLSKGGRGSFMDPYTHVKSNNDRFSFPGAGPQGQVLQAFLIDLGAPMSSALLLHIPRCQQ